MLLQCKFIMYLARSPLSVVVERNKYVKNWKGRTEQGNHPADELSTQKTGTCSAGLGPHPIPSTNVYRSTTLTVRRKRLAFYYMEIQKNLYR